MELPAHWHDWDLGLELPDDVSAADWLDTGLRPWGQDGLVVANFVPASYEAFARVLHPAGDGERRDVRWADLAARTGGHVSPDTGFRAASGLNPKGDLRAWDRAVPSDGSLPHAQLAALAAVLGTATSTPERCMYCFWIGWGAWGEADELDRLPLVRLPHRDHYLLTGPLARMGTAVRLEGGFERAPSLWWPADRAWFVATEIDGYSTYVGGSAACIGAVLTCPGVEAIAVSAETPLDPWIHG
ncbi:MAG TPA: hypothetical protein VGL44_08300 [Gaiellales bacterium]